MKNVHEFDRKVNIRFQQEASCPENRDPILHQFLNQSFLSEEAKKMTKDIIFDTSGKNQDTINGANARDLLVQLLIHIEKLKEEEKKDMYSLLNEQLQDMIRLGPCAQGRTIRLWQLLQCCGC